MPVATLRTARLVLQPFDAGDADLLVDLDGDPEVVHFITGGAPTPRTEVEGEVLPAFLRERPGGYGYWKASEDGAFAGFFQLRPRPDAPPDEPELGYRLRRTAWGRGLGREGAQALVDHAFADLGARRVVAETMVVNTRSRRVMEACGLVHVRTFHASWPVRIPGDEHGDVEYAITREAWAARQG